MYCVYMSQEHLADEPAQELYGDLIDENYQWRPGASDETDTGDTPEFLQEESGTSVDLMTGEGTDQ